VRDRRAAQFLGSSTAPLPNAAGIRQLGSHQLEPQGGRGVLACGNSHAEIGFRPDLLAAAHSETPVMLELDNQITRLEIVSEQLRLHLRSLPRETVEAEEVRSDLLTMLQDIVHLKGERQKLEAEIRMSKRQ
jgi:hypothetical protein